MVLVLLVAVAVVPPDGEGVVNMSCGEDRSMVMIGLDVGATGMEEAVPVDKRGVYVKFDAVSSAEAMSVLWVLNDWPDQCLELTAMIIIWMEGMNGLNRSRLSSTPSSNSDTSIQYFVPSIAWLVHTRYIHACIDKWALVLSSSLCIDHRPTSRQVSKVCPGPLP